MARMTVPIEETAQGLELTFALVPTVADSASQAISWANPADTTANTDSVPAFFRGVHLVRDATAGTITARAWDGDPDGAGPSRLIYEAAFDLTTETVDFDMLGADAIDAYDDLYLTLQSDTAGMNLTATPYVGLGALVSSN